MKTKTTHTPAPLFVESTQGTGVYYLEKVTDLDGHMVEIATFTNHADGKRNADLKKEDKELRAFIVRAVNSHEELETIQAGTPWERKSKSRRWIKTGVVPVTIEVEIDPKGIANAVSSAIHNKSGVSKYLHGAVIGRKVQS